MGKQDVSVTKFLLKKKLIFMPYVFWIISLKISFFRVPFQNFIKSSLYLSGRASDIQSSIGASCCSNKES